MSDIRFSYLGEFESREKAIWAGGLIEGVLDAVYEAGVEENAGKAEFGRVTLERVFGRDVYMYLTVPANVETKRNFVAIEIRTNSCFNSEAPVDLLLKFGATQVHKGSSQFPLLSVLREAGFDRIEEE